MASYYIKKGFVMSAALLGVAASIFSVVSDYDHGLEKNDLMQSSLQSNPTFRKNIIYSSAAGIGRVSCLNVKSAFNKDGVICGFYNRSTWSTPNSFHLEDLKPFHYAKFDFSIDSGGKFGYGDMGAYGVVVLDIDLNGNFIVRYNPAETVIYRKNLEMSLSKIIEYAVVYFRLRQSNDLKASQKARDVIASYQ